MTVTITTQFYRASAWEDIGKIVFTSPNIDSPAVKDTRSHILPGQEDLALWYEDDTNMYRILDDQDQTYTEAGKTQATPMCKIDLYSGETFKFDTDSSVLVGVEGESAKSLDLQSGDYVYYNGSNYGVVDRIIPLASGLPLVVDNKTLTFYSDSFLYTPLGGDGNVRQGSTYKIYWTASGIYQDETVDVYYSTNYGRDWSTLASGTTNDGELDFTILSTTDGGMFRMFALSETVEEFSELFKVVPIGLAVNDTLGGQTIESGNTHRVWWDGTYFYLNEAISVDFSDDNGSSWTTLASGISNAGYADVYIPPNTSSQCKVKVYSPDNTYVPEDESDLFTCTYSQTITILYPTASGLAAQPGENYPVYWSATNLQDEETNLYVALSVDGGSNYEVVVSGTLNDGYHSVLIPNTTSSGDVCKVKVGKINEPSILGTSVDFTVEDPYIEMVYYTGAELTVANNDAATHFWWNTNIPQGETFQVYDETSAAVLYTGTASGTISIDLPNNSSTTYNVKHTTDAGATITAASGTGTITKTEFVTTSGIVDGVSGAMMHSCYYDSYIYSISTAGIYKQHITDGSYEFIPMDLSSSFDFLIAVKSSTIYLYETNIGFIATYDPATEDFEIINVKTDINNILVFDDNDDYIYALRGGTSPGVYTFDTVTKTWSLLYETTSMSHTNGLTKLDTGVIAFINDRDIVNVVDGATLYTFPNTPTTVNGESVTSWGYIYSSNMAANRVTTSSGVLNVDGSYSISYPDGQGGTATSVQTINDRFNYSNTTITLVDGFANYLNSGDSPASSFAYSLGETGVFVAYGLSGADASGNAINYSVLPNSIGVGEDGFIKNNKLYLIGGNTSFLPMYEVNLSDSVATISGCLTSDTPYAYATLSGISNYRYKANEYGGMCFDGTDTVYVLYKPDVDNNVFYKYTLSTNTVTELATSNSYGTAVSMTYNANTTKVYVATKGTDPTLGLAIYDVSGNSWDFMSLGVDCPQNPNIIALGNYVYFVSNDADDKTFARVDASSPAGIESLADLAIGEFHLCTDGTSYIYAIQENSPYYIYRYNPTGDVWAIFHKFDNVTDIRFCDYDSNYIYTIYGTTDNSLSYSKTPTVVDYITYTTPVGFTPPPSHQSITGEGGDSNLDTSQPGGWSAPGAMPTQTPPSHGPSFPEIITTVPIVSTTWGNVIQFGTRVGTTTVYDTESLYWWNINQTNSSWITCDNSIVITMTEGECYFCKLTAWDDTTHLTSNKNYIVKNNMCRVHAIAFNSNCAVTASGTSSFTPSEVFAVPAYNQILRGGYSQYEYDGFNMKYRTSGSVYGDYLMFKPYLYGIDSSVPYGVHDFIITFHYSYT